MQRIDKIWPSDLLAQENKKKSKKYLTKADSSNDNKLNKILHEKNIDTKNVEPLLIKNGPHFLKNFSSGINRERIAMLTAKMELKAPPPKPPRQLSLVSQEYKLPKNNNRLENTYDAPKQPQSPHYTPFMLADLEVTDSESSYSSDEGDTGQELSMKAFNYKEESGLLDQDIPYKKPTFKKTVSFSDKITIIPDYIYKEELEKYQDIPSEKKHSVQSIMSNINKMNSKKKDSKQMKQIAPNSQRLSNKLLDFFQQKRIFTSEKPFSPNLKSNINAKPESLTHLTKTRPRKPSSMRKSHGVKVVS